MPDADVILTETVGTTRVAHVRVGVPGGGMTARLPIVVGEARARRMSLTGEVVDAETAFRIGLVTEVVPHAACATARSRSPR
jgi:enoyl-CoA hydratase/carnithine racemase